MRDNNIKAAVSIVATKDGEIALSKSKEVDDEMMKLFAARMLWELGITPESLKEESNEEMPV